MDASKRSRGWPAPNADARLCAIGVQARLRRSSMICTTGLRVSDSLFVVTIAFPCCPLRNLPGRFSPGCADAPHPYAKSGRSSTPRGARTPDDLGYRVAEPLATARPREQLSNGPGLVRLTLRRLPDCPDRALQIREAPPPAPACGLHRRDCIPRHGARSHPTRPRSGAPRATRGSLSVAAGALRYAPANVKGSIRSLPAPSRSSHPCPPPHPAPDPFHRVGFISLLKHLQLP
jgi:hypothetical protein